MKSLKESFPGRSETRIRKRLELMGLLAVRRTDNIKPWNEIDDTILKNHVVLFKNAEMSPNKIREAMSKLLLIDRGFDDESAPEYTMFNQADSPLEDAKNEVKGILDAIPDDVMKVKYRNSTAVRNMALALALERTPKDIAMRIGRLSLAEKAYVRA